MSKKWQITGNTHNLGSSVIVLDLITTRYHIEELLEVALFAVHDARDRRLGNRLATLLKILANLIVRPVLRSKLPHNVEVLQC